MKFHELDYPDCGVCTKKKLQRYGVQCDAEGNVIKVYCTECGDKIDLDRHTESKRLRSSLCLTASLKAFYALETTRDRRPCDPRYLEIDAAMKRVQVVVERFDALVWFKGLQKIVRASKTRGMKSNPIEVEGLGPMEILEFSSAGRAVMTLDTKTASVTVITAEDEDTSRMGWQGIDGTEEEAILMLDTAIEAWTAGKVTMAEDTKVGF